MNSARNFILSFLNEKMMSVFHMNEEKWIREMKGKGRNCPPSSDLEKGNSGPEEPLFIEAVEARSGTGNMKEKKVSPGKPMLRSANRLLRQEEGSNDHSAEIPSMINDR